MDTQVEAISQKLDSFQANFREMSENYQITRYEEKGESLFIALQSKNKPVYLEHFLTPEEKADIAGTITALAAQLSIMDDDYVAPVPTVSKLDSLDGLVITDAAIQAAKIKIKADKAKVK